MRSLNRRGLYLIIFILFGMIVGSCFFSLITRKKQSGMGDLSHTFTPKNFKGMEVRPIAKEEKEKEDELLIGKYKFDTRKRQSPFTREQKEMDEESFVLIASCEREVERMKNWMNRFSKNETVLLIASNYGFRTFLLNSWCSMDNVDPQLRNKMVLWALDWKMFEFLANLTSPNGPYQFGVFFDPNLVGGEELAPGGANSFDELMGIRPKFLANFARTGLNLLFVDADITWYDDPWKQIFSKEIIESKPDWIFTLDSRDIIRPDRFHDLFIPELCAGMYWMRGSEKNARVWEMVYKRMVIDKNSSDQILLNRVLEHHALLVGPPIQGFHIGVTNNPNIVSSLAPRVAILNQMQFINGYIYKNYHEKYCLGQEILLLKNQKRVMVHGNWWHSDKLSDFRTMPDIWFLEKDDVTCKPFRDPKTLLGCIKE
eukprot:TRINITY_DN4311_c0_g1_i1.p1 TRINITY_DN4311_c0_g1~~TRINITY_DN4311_c0_g1_i1.p1  ORF type:complete len:428 (+),score=92.65 TRINITY_DN4311_c0_g1_i1:345-1628(+)